MKKNWLKGLLAFGVAILLSFSFGGVASADDILDSLGNPIDVPHYEGDYDEESGLYYGYESGQIYPTASLSRKPHSSISIKGHVQNIGWQGYSNVAGTTGKSLRLEAIYVTVDSRFVGGSVSYQAHTSNRGWLPDVKEGDYAGITGRSLGMEAVRINLFGGMSKNFHVEYRGHVQNIGWQKWVRNGQTAGTTGRALRLEAVQVRLINK